MNSIPLFSPEKKEVLRSIIRRMNQKYFSFRLKAYWSLMALWVFLGYFVNYGADYYRSDRYDTVFNFLGIGSLGLVFIFIIIFLLPKLSENRIKTLVSEQYWKDVLPNVGFSPIDSGFIILWIPIMALFQIWVSPGHEGYTMMNLYNDSIGLPRHFIVYFCIPIFFILGLELTTRLFRLIRSLTNPI